MRSATVIGLQWGDEGKGKVIDAFASEADVVVRYQGGGNAGHTVIAKGVKYVFHHVPTGILYPKVTCVVGNGTVLDVGALQTELAELTKQGVDLSNLRLSSRAHVVMPYHRALDEAREQARGGTGQIGTTKRGIGPCYADKASRTGIRLADLYDPQRFAERLRRNLDEKNAILVHLFRRPPLAFEPIREACLDAAEALRPYVCDTARVAQDALAAGKRVMFEGAQGIMLDLDHGTYPFVTSSSASSAGVSSGAGVPPAAAGKVVGVAKAYTTRVGSGPFPTELLGEPGDRLRELGKEYGATTGRPRRCGWLDLVQLGEAVRLTGCAGIVLTKLDTLAGFGPLKVAVAYERGGKRHEGFPADEGGWEELTPVYEELPAIAADPGLLGATEEAQLPGEAREYVAFIERRLGVPVSVVSTGPQREALIRRSDVLGF
ncbi:MAG: adenylosuccinate synthase [Planctomycetes bacterium]|nr:adenylosuccinate synthase [Planctomycetota bacterium]